MEGSPVKLACSRPRQNLCTYQAYQCDRPCYLGSPYCDAHVCEVQTLRSMTGSSHPVNSGPSELTVEVSSPSRPNVGPLSSGGETSTDGSPTGTHQPQPPPAPIIQCQYRVRRYERRCRNPVPPDGGDVHFCSEHRARVASRRDPPGSNTMGGSAACATSSSDPAVSICTSSTNTGNALVSNSLTGDNTSGSNAIASITSAIIQDYQSLPEKWLGVRTRGSSSSNPGQSSIDAHFGHGGLPMPKAKEERGEWHEDWDSDAESPASDDDEKMDGIRNAGTYTLQEMIIYAMFHQRKLMLLYQEHMAALRRLAQHDYALYEETRRDHRQMRTATNTIIMRGRQAEMFRALRKFKRYSGSESLIHEKAKRIRLRSVCPEKIKPTANPQRCAYNDPTKDEKCPERVLPLCKYCPKHILHQANQCLFEPCRAERCDQPVLRSAVEDKETYSPGAAQPGIDRDQYCVTHRPEESLLDFIPPDMTRSSVEEAISGLKMPPEPPPESVAAARAEAAAAAAAAGEAVSPDKARAMRREDSISLHEQFDFQLLMPDMMDMPDMDPRFMEEALSVLRDPDHGGAAVGSAMPGGLGGAGGGGATGPVWDDIAHVIDLGSGSELWPGDLEPLTEVWERLVAGDAGVDERRKADGGLVGLEGLGEEQEAGADKDEEVEVDEVGDLDLQVLAAESALARQMSGGCQLPNTSVASQQMQQLHELQQFAAGEGPLQGQPQQIQELAQQTDDPEPQTLPREGPLEAVPPNESIETHQVMQNGSGQTLQVYAEDNTFQHQQEDLSETSPLETIQQEMPPSVSRLEETQKSPMEVTEPSPTTSESNLPQVEENSDVPSQEVPMQCEI